MNRLLLIALLIFLTPAMILAKVRIPEDLNGDDQKKVLGILGLGTNSKILTDPYPLGGYAGFELGVEYHTISVTRLAKTGDQFASQGGSSRKQDFFSYPTITLGKGLYNNLDIFLHFMPFSEGTGISEYGGALRWGAYQMAYYPISFAVIINGNSTNINDLIITKNYGVDLTVGITTQNLFIYTGAGWTKSTGEFVGGANGITTSQDTEQVSVQSYHSMMGAGFRVSDFFLVLQADVYYDPTYSAKIGFRY